MALTLLTTSACSPALNLIEPFVLACWLDSNVNDEKGGRIYVWSYGPCTLQVRVRNVSVLGFFTRDCCRGSSRLAPFENSVGSFRAGLCDAFGHCVEQASATAMSRSCRCVLTFCKTGITPAGPCLHCIGFWQSSLRGAFHAVRKERAVERGWVNRLSKPPGANHIQSSRRRRQGHCVRCVAAGASTRGWTSPRRATGSSPWTRCVSP